MKLKHEYEAPYFTISATFMALMWRVRGRQMGSFRTLF